MRDAAGLRFELHRHPELSGREAGTARRIEAFFRPIAPDATIAGLGGHGLAFVFHGAAPGPTVLLRCDMDALPITEAGSSPRRSKIPGVSHACGHDGHMAVLAAVGAELGRERPARGRVVLLFQPAEETGEGAAAVLADERFADLAPDLCFALHNLPGRPLGEVVVREGPFACASRGMRLTLTGATAHAAQPETGRSPARAVSRILDALAGLGEPEAGAFATVVGVRLGEKAFGTAPGRAEVWATLRGESDEAVEDLGAEAERIVAAAAQEDGLDHGVAWEDVFPAAVNTPEAVEVVRRAAAPLNVTELERPFRWSEDFGRFTAACGGALFGIGAGTDAPDLHDPDYEFPDELIAPAAGLMLRIIDACGVEREESP